MRLSCQWGVLCGLLFGLILASPPVRAGDSWNLLEPDTEERSRLASARLFDAASSVFAGLALIERKRFETSESRFKEASELLEKAAQELEILSKDKAAGRGLNARLLQKGERERLMSWYSGVEMKFFSPEVLEKLSISNLLSAASRTAREIAGALKDMFGRVEGDNPDRANRAISSISEFLAVGSIATKTFRASQ